VSEQTDEQRIDELLQPEAIELRGEVARLREETGTLRAALVVAEENADEAEREVKRLRAELAEANAWREHLTNPSDTAWLEDLVRDAAQHVVNRADYHVPDHARRAIPDEIGSLIRAGALPRIDAHVIDLACGGLEPLKQLAEKAEAERDRLAEQVNGDRLHAIIEAALIAYWRLDRGKEPDQSDIAAAGSHAYVLVDALRHAGLPTGRAPAAVAHGVREAVTEAVRALDGTAADR
jgi:hypothetical protein